MFKKYTPKIPTPKSQPRGFTILESVVVIFVISVGLVSMASLITQNTQVQYVNKNMIIASQLAQEGLEVVRNIRDDNFITTGNDWKLGTGGVSDQSNIIKNGIYAIDYTGKSTIVPNINDPAAKLYLNSDNFYYHPLSNESGASSTPFSRIIQIDSESDASTTVTCIVQWQKGTNVTQYTAQTVLYNWR